MIFIVVIEMLLIACCSGDTSNPAVSSTRFHRKDIPLSYEFNTVHLNDHNKDDSQSKSHHQLRPRQEICKNIQYAPLELSSEQQGDVKTPRNTISTPGYIELTKLPVTDVTASKTKIEPQIFQQYNEKVNNNEPSIPLTYVAGHNIKVEPKTNKIVDKGDQNYGFPDGNIKFNDRSNLHTYYLNDISEHRETTPVLRHSQITGTDMLEQYTERPINNIKILSELESPNIHPIFNPYVKIPRLHLNIARAYKISHGQNRELSNRHLKFLINKPKRKNELKVEVMPEQKWF